MVPTFFADVEYRDITAEGHAVQIGDERDFLGGARIELRIEATPQFTRVQSTEVQICCQVEWYDH